MKWFWSKVSLCSNKGLRRQLTLGHGWINENKCQAFFFLTCKHTYTRDRTRNPIKTTSPRPPPPRTADRSHPSPLSYKPSKKGGGDTDQPSKCRKCDNNSCVSAASSQERPAKTNSGKASSSPRNINPLRGLHWRRETRSDLASEGEWKCSRFRVN